MVFYTALFLALLYFKIARVHKNEERLNISIKIHHFFMAIAIFSMLMYGYFYVNLFHWIPSLFVFATIASMMVTAVQVGVFVNGKPLFKISDLYRLFPLLLGLSILLSALIWVQMLMNPL